MNYVVTVLKSGGVYLPEHVGILSRNVAQHMSTPFEFVVLTDLGAERWTNGLVSAADIIVPLEHDWPGWWSKIELFRPGMPWDGMDKVLYLDLDTQIVGDISHFFSHALPFIMLKSFRSRRWASGVMGWTGAAPRRPYRRFLHGPGDFIRKNRRAGDQKFIMDSMEGKAEPAFWQEIFPEQVVSYKRHCRGANGKGGSPPAKARVVCFHGKPRPWHASEKWIQEVWQNG